MLGKIVKVTVDRPMGTYHPKHKDIYYQINYGYIEGIMGVNKPVEEFTGKVIAIIHRLNDVEDKWVVAPEDERYSKEQIEEQVQFQEKYFEYEILCERLNG